MMKKYLILPLLFLFAASLYCAPQKVIFDTDMGNDIDDVLALVMLYSYENSGDIKLDAIAMSEQDIYCAMFVNILDEYYSGARTPLYLVRNGTSSKSADFTHVASDIKMPDGSYKFPRRIGKNTILEDSVKGLRKTLAASEDSSVVYISVGFLTNLAKLMRSPADEISPLSGMELLKKKVKYISVMAGEYKINKDYPKRESPEYNIDCDIQSAKFALENSPIPVVLSGWELGDSVRFPHSEVDKLSPENPARVAYDIFAKFANPQTGRHDRSTWDLTSVLYVVNPNIFDISEYGDIKVVPTKNGKGGVSIFKANPEGKYRYLKLRDAKATKNELIKVVHSAKPVMEKK